MKLFARLYAELDSTTKTTPKVEALERYFREAPPEDAVWALALLTGRRIKRAVTSTELRDAAATAAGLPAWLLDECYDAVGDLSETISLVAPEPTHERDIPLHAALEHIITPMRRMDDVARRRTLVETWDQLPLEQRFIFCKLISGSFRVGVSRTLAVRALANVAGVPQAEMEHRVMGDWGITADAFRAMLAGTAGETAVARPFPFFLASQLDDPPESLGPLADWQVEWKWDGIRAQLIRRQGQTLLWSRGEELITDRYPEIADAGAALPDGLVLDGEILAWDSALQKPLPFAALQTRIGRSRYRAQGEWLFVETPTVFVAYDALEAEGIDVRSRPLAERRSLLESVVQGASPVLRTSPLVREESWEALAALRAESRSRGVEGLMLKHLASPYAVGRTRGDWWKWKIDPYHIDAVLIAAQPGSGRRASVFTDYTFGLWSGQRSGEGELVSVAKAYSGLTDKEIDRVDAFVRANTTGKFGPVRTVKPALVFELAFEAIQESTRHKSGIAVRFPRIARWRDDKKPEDADTLDTLRSLLRAPS